MLHTPRLLTDYVTINGHQFIVLWQINVTMNERTNKQGVEGQFTGKEAGGLCNEYGTKVGKVM